MLTAVGDTVDRVIVDRQSPTARSGNETRRIVHALARIHTRALARLRGFNDDQVFTPFFKQKTKNRPRRLVAAALLILKTVSGGQLFD